MDLCTIKLYCLKTASLTFGTITISNAQAWEGFAKASAFTTRASYPTGSYRTGPCFGTYVCVTITVFVCVTQIHVSAYCIPLIATQDMPMKDSLNDLVAEQDQSKGDSLLEPKAGTADSETALVV